MTALDPTHRWPNALDAGLLDYAMSIAEVDDAADDDAVPSEIDEVRARLAARGLLATSRRVEISRSEHPKVEDGVAPAPVDAVVPEAQTDHWAVSPLDDWDVPPNGVREAVVACPGCGDRYFRPLEATRFSCETCDRSWRFAICTACDDLSLTVERQESWRCRCGASSRSWWRTPTGRAVASDVVLRRKHLAVEQERRAVRVGMRQRRWKLIALAVWAAVASVGVVIGVRMAEPSSATGNPVTCAHFDRFRSDVLSGTLSLEEINAELDELQREAEGASSDLQSALLDLRAAGNPSSAAFLVARTTVADTCARLTSR